jgi:hypothetical protein
MIFKVCSPEKVGALQYLWRIGAQVADMEQVLKCSHSCGWLQLCAAASACVQLVTLVLKARSLKATTRCDVEAIGKHEVDRNHF